MPKRAADDAPTASTGPTISGARLKPIGVRPANTFISRFANQPLLPKDAVIYGAFEHGGQLIGVAAIWDINQTRASATVVVTPERRRLKVGTDLLDDLLQHASGQGLRFVGFTNPTASLRALVSAMGLTVAQRVETGTPTHLVVLVTDA